jgi:hypothetical protein
VWQAGAFLGWPLSLSLLEAGDPPKVMLPFLFTNGAGFRREKSCRATDHAFYRVICDRRFNLVADAALHDLSAPES